MKFVATIEARMASTRLPGKVLLPVAGQPLLAHLIERLQRVPRLDQIVIATTTNPEDEPIVHLAGKVGVGCFRGSEEDVLGRVLGAARAYRADVIVEITGDCPAIDPEIIQTCIDAYLETQADYVSNVLSPTFPWGMDTQVFATDVLAQADAATAGDAAAREHVSLYIYEHPDLYKLYNVSAPAGLAWPEVHIELDTPEDYQLIKAIFESLYPKNPAFSLTEIIRFLRGNAELLGLNEHIKRKSAR